MHARFVLPAAVVLAGVSAFLLTAQQQRPVVSTAVLTKAPAEEWVTHGRDYAETHFSPLKQIDTANAGKLGLAWTFETNSAPGNIEGNPLVHDGIMYGSLTNSVLYAIDARSGAFKWRWDPEIPSQSVVTKDGKRVRVGPSVCCGRVNRGVALYNGKIFAGLLDGRLVAINANTGKLEWETQTTPKESDYSITMAPRVVKGKVIIGASGAEYAVRGMVSAYDAETGKQAWRFYTVPGDPSKPFENSGLEMAAKTWKGSEWWKMGGGGTVWDGIAFDPDLDLLYVGTGNGGPWLQEIRSPGGGDNLFLSSILALRPDTGEYVWHYQTTPGDNWDYTAVQPLQLADLEIGGRTRKVIMQAPKNGFFYVVDRTNGEFISAYAYANVTWAKGVDQKSGRPIESEIARFGPEGAYISPGPGGAHNWHAMSFNPLTKFVYIPGNESRFYYRPDPNFSFKENDASMNWGILLGGPPAENAKQAPVPTPATGEPERPVTGGFLLAWDPVTQKEVWRHRTGSFGGTLTTAGGLVFAGTNDGTFHAYNAANGQEVWKMQVTRGNFANPVSYTLDGKQYVSVLAGNPNARVFTFTLDGNAPVPPLPQPAAAKGKAK